MKKINIILDTDIGDDIDDAFALTALLNLQDKVNLIGVTTVFVNTDHRARMIKKLFKLHNFNAPVYAGIKNGAKNPYLNVDSKCCQFTDDLLDDEYKPDNDVSEDTGQAAVDFLINKARELGEDLTIICIGPYSNIGEAIRKDYDAFKHCKIVTMGGNFYSRAFIEWNIYCDPNGAKSLIESGLNVTCIGLDVTMKATLNKQQFDELVSFKVNPYYEYMSQIIMMHKNVQHSKDFYPTLHDPLAVFYAVFNDYVKVEKQLIKVETKGEYTNGETVNIDYLYHYEPTLRSGNRINTAYEVDGQRFLNDYINIYKKEF